MSKWYYTDAQIRTMYRDALDRAEQIEILSQLEAKPKEQIIEKLEQLGEVIEIRRVDRRRRVKRQDREERIILEWNKEDIETVRKMVESGCCMKHIMTIMHTSTETLKRIMTENGIPFPKKYRRNTWPDEKKEQLRDLIKEDVPETKIRKIMHISEPVLKRYRKELGI